MSKSDKERVLSTLRAHPIAMCAAAVTVLSFVVQIVNGWTARNDRLDWIASASTFVLMIFWFPVARLHRGQQERLKEGKCIHCGYDTRANIDRCPEYGEPLTDRK